MSSHRSKHSWGNVVFSSVVVIIFIIQAIYHHYTIGVLQQKIQEHEQLLQSLLPQAGGTVTTNNNLPITHSNNENTHSHTSTSAQSTSSSSLVTAISSLVHSNFSVSLHNTKHSVVDRDDAFLPHSTLFLTTKSPPNQPAIQPTAAEAERVNKLRGVYGGKDDPAHLGGFVDFDQNTISKNSWKLMLGFIGVRSVIDVGCGRGFSANYFLRHHAKVLCVEGSRDAIKKSLLPRESIVEHDFYRGPWWPEETYDAVWSTEFVEHVSRQHMKNYLPIFKKSALLFITSSGWGGWHHVEVHHPNWWATKLSTFGFVHSPYLTDLMQKHARVDKAQAIAGIQVFVNPVIASLPKHRHLISGYGCFDDSIDNLKGGLPCDTVDTLPVEYQPLLECQRDVSSFNITCRHNPNYAAIRALAGK